VTSEGNYSAEVRKILNKEATSPVNTKVLNVQNAAIPATVALAEGQSDTIGLGSAVELSFTNIDSTEHSYIY
jgi:hypothetical protein